MNQTVSCCCSGLNKKHAGSAKGDITTDFYWKRSFRKVLLATSDLKRGFQQTGVSGLETRKEEPTGTEGQEC